MKLLKRHSAPPTLRERIMERLPLEQVKERMPLEQIKDRIPFTIQRKQEPPSRIRRAAPAVAAGAAGAALAFVFDPDNGSARRAKARELVARARRTSDSIEAASKEPQPMSEFVARQASAR